MGGSRLSEPFLPYLNRPLAEDVAFPPSPASKRRITKTGKELLRKRARLDPLLGLFQRWATAALKPGEQVDLDGVVVVMPPKGEDAGVEFDLRLSIKNITSLLAFKHTVAELVTLACLGDDGSLFRLVELDKVFLTAEFTRERIWQAQTAEDWGYFESLSRSVRVDSYRRKVREVMVGLACYMLWFLGFRELPRDELLDFLESERLAKYKDPFSFYHMLNRIGLRKYERVARRLRHTSACQWLERGGSLASLQQILGHASVVTTQRYARLSDEHVRAEAERIAGRVAADVAAGNSQRLDSFQVSPLETGSN